MRPLAVFPLILLAIYTSGTPAVTIPMTRLQRTGAYLKGAAHADRARAAFFNSRPENESRKSSTVPATNLAYAQYTVSVGIGNPPTYYQLVVDTGSSNTFCGTGIPYVQTNTSVFTAEIVYVTYGSGYFGGFEYLDRVTLGPGLVIESQSIGDAELFSGFPDVDGLLGVGPVDLTQGTLLTDPEAVIPTVMNNLVSQGLVEKQILGVYFAPPTNKSDTNGALTYGSDDLHLYTGKLTYVPVTKKSPASQYWGIDLDSVTYGNLTVVHKATAGVVDTGTTIVLIADDFFSAYMKAIPGAVYNSDLGLLVIPPASVSSMKTLTFLIGNTTFPMDVTAQLVPMDENEAWGGNNKHRYGTVGPMGSPSGQGLDFILGQKFMERYYAVFDGDKKRVGFAQTVNTFT